MPTPVKILPDVASSYVARRCPRFYSLLPFSASTALAMISLGMLLFAGCEKKPEAAKPQPPEVSVVEPLQQDVPIYEELVAQLNGPVNAEITPKVQGYLLRQDYSNGYFVKKGQLLFDLDPRQYQASVDQAKADVAAAEANLTRVQADVARDTPLAAQSAIPQKQLDNDIANQASWEAQLKAKKAALDNAELNLGWTKVYSPIDGIAGVSNSQIGDLVGTATKMTTVSQVNPIWAYFNISESHFLSVAPLISDVIMGKISIKQAHSAPVEYIQADDEPYPAKGKFIYINRQVGTQTGTIQMAQNPRIPMLCFVPAALGGCASRRAPAPTRLRSSGFGDAGAIHVPGTGGHARERSRICPVEVGDRVGPTGSLPDGLKPGEKVVVDGLLKIQQFAALDRKQRSRKFRWWLDRMTHQRELQGRTDHAQISY